MKRTRKRIRKLSPYFKQYLIFALLQTLFFLILFGPNFVNGYKNSCHQLDFLPEPFFAEPKRLTKRQRRRLAYRSQLFLNKVNKVKQILFRLGVPLAFMLWPKLAWAFSPGLGVSSSTLEFAFPLLLLLMGKLLTQRKKPKPDKEQNKNLDEKTKRCIERIERHQAKQSIDLDLVEKDRTLARLEKLIDDLAIEKAFDHKYDKSRNQGRNPILISTKLRIHILKAKKNLRSFNETCKEIKSNDTYQAFCRQKSVSAGSLTNFRNNFSYQDCRTLILIFVKKAIEIGLFKDCHLHVCDSTDLESPCSWKPTKFNTKWDKKEKKNKEIGIYRDKSARKGKRSNKKGKSKWVVGHRKHTLGIVVDSKVIPIFSLIAPGNSNDQNFLLPLIRVGKSLGFELNYLVADLGYIDQKDKELAKQKYGVVVRTDKKENTKLPEMVDSKRGWPLCSYGYFMKWLEYDEETAEHIYGCPFDSPHQECILAGSCERQRTISSKEYPIAFPPGFPVHLSVSRKMSAKRKAIEPVFWRNRWSGGLDKITLQRIHNVRILSTVADIYDILDSMATFLEQKEAQQILIIFLAITNLVELSRLKNKTQQKPR